MKLIDQVRCSSEEICASFQIKRLGVFGSVARGHEDDHSDIDLFVEFENPTPETMPIRYFGLIQEMSRRYNRSVQVVTPAMVKNPFFRRAMQRDLTMLYG